MVNEEIAADKDKVENYNSYNYSSMLRKCIAKKEWALLSDHLADDLRRNQYFYTTKKDVEPEVWHYKDGIYIPDGKTVIREFVRGEIGFWYSEYIANLVIAKIMVDTYVDHNDFFNPKNIDEVAVLNGILNLTTKTLTAFDPKKIFFQKINAAYIPTIKCLQVEKFLKEILPDAEDQLTVFEMFGYTMYREYFIERAFMLLGSGRNGKGALIKLLGYFLGKNNIVAIPLQKLEMGEFKECELMGKLANIAGDISNYPMKTTSKFKSLTGRDPITASRKFKNDVSFDNYCKQIFATNELPKTYDLTVGFFDRWQYLVFPFTFKEKKEYDELMKTLPESEKAKYKVMNEHRLTDVLTSDEMSGLLNSALEGLDRLFKNGSFSSSKTGTETRKWWIDHSDSFLAFAESNIEQDGDGVISKDDLRKEYQKYCKKNHIKAEGDKHIKEILFREFTAGEEQSFVALSNTRVYNWTGIKLKVPVTIPVKTITFTDPTLTEAVKNE
jgi:putative DNA primase/helicase